MDQVNCNCIVCASEFNPEELQSVALSKLNITRFKICQSCLDRCDPTNDYREARSIINSYLVASDAKHLFEDVRKILDNQKE